MAPPPQNAQERSLAEGKSPSGPGGAAVDGLEPKWLRRHLCTYCSMYLTTLRVLQYIRTYLTSILSYPPKAPHFQLALAALRGTRTGPAPPEGPVGQDAGAN